MVSSFLYWKNYWSGLKSYLELPKTRKIEYLNDFWYIPTGSWNRNTSPWILLFRLPRFWSISMFFRWYPASLYSTTKKVSNLSADTISISLRHLLEGCRSQETAWEFWIYIYSTHTVYMNQNKKQIYFKEKFISLYISHKHKRKVSNICFYIWYKYPISRKLYQWIVGWIAINIGLYSWLNLTISVHIYYYSVVDITPIRYLVECTMRI